MRVLKRIEDPDADVGCRDSAIAEGAVYCAETRSFRIHRINRCSIGLLQDEPWDPKKPGHPPLKPTPDPLTGQLLVKDCIKFLMKRVSYYFRVSRAVTLADNIPAES